MCQCVYIRSDITVSSSGRFLFATFRRKPVQSDSDEKFPFDDVQQQTPPNQLLAVDHLGTVYKFDLTKNKYFSKCINNRFGLFFVSF